MSEKISGLGVTQNHSLSSFFRRMIQFKPNEGALVAWASAYSFLILFSYYLIRPLRDSMGTKQGVIEFMPWLWTCTLVAMIFLNPLYGFLVSRFSRRRFIPWVYYFFSGNLLLFAGALLLLQGNYWAYAARFFFVWAAIFNLFVVSVQWDFLTDVFQVEQGKRLFGFIFAAGSLGGILGPVFAEIFTHLISPLYGLLLGAVALQIAIICVKRLGKHARETIPVPTIVDPAEQPPGKSTFSGVVALFSSPYLLGISGYIILYTLVGTAFYLKQNQVAHDQLPSTTLSTLYFARTDFFTNLFSAILQAFVAGRVMTRFGIAKTLSLLPIFTIFGVFFLWWSPNPQWSFLSQWLHWTPQLFWLMILQILLRAFDFSLAKPARKVLFTVVTRDEKYSAQSIIDTLVPRFGDAIASWSKVLLSSHGIEVTRAALYGTPLYIAWIFLAHYLGKEQAKRAKRIAPTTNP